MSLFAHHRGEFLRKVAGSISPLNTRIIVLTHFLPDRPDFLDAIRLISPIERVIAIPYSTDQQTLKLLRTSYAVETPDLVQLRSEEYLVSLVTSLGPGAPVAVIEIGGYFAPVLQTLKSLLGESFLGAVEDTELGHRRYIEFQPLPCPVVSVARSKLKRGEDSLAGLSCVYSVESIFRAAGLPLVPCIALVLGYGRIGTGVAAALRERGCHTMVYDIDPIQRTIALGDGFPIPDRRHALQSAQAIFGATGTPSIRGEDFDLLRNGVVLASCSSKDVEFDLVHLREYYSIIRIHQGLENYTLGARTLSLCAGGYPVNFMQGAVIGPLLSLVQAEIMVALARLWECKDTPGLHEVTLDRQTSLASDWLQDFCDINSGGYRTT
jgi:adenosylhomocysteinase